MKLGKGKFWGLVFVFLLTVPLASQTIDRLCADIGLEDYAAREKAKEALFTRALTDQKIIVQKVVRLSETTENPEIRFGAAELLNRIYVRYELGIGGSDFGLELGWFIDHNGKNVSSFPLVLAVDEDGPAAKAGISPGDVLTRMNGKNTRSHQSRNEMVRKLAKIKAGTEVVFQRKHSGLAEPFSLYNKNKRDEVKVVPITRLEEEEEEIEIDENAYQDWLDNFR